MDAMKKFSAMLYYLFIPVYSFMEISHVTSLESIKAYWILCVSTTTCILTGYFLARIFHYSCSLEERISESFSMTLAFPAIGSLPLVISKLMCFPGGPLEGEKSCPNATGLMIVNFIIYMFFLHVIGILLVKKDKDLNDIINAKLQYLWHIILNKFQLKDYFALFITEKYLSDPTLSVSIYKNFIENFKLEADEKYYYKLMIDKEKFTEKQLVVEASDLNKELKGTIEMKEIVNIEDQKLVKTQPQGDILLHGMDFHLKENTIDKMKSNLKVEIDKNKNEEIINYFNSSNVEENMNIFVENMKKHKSVKFLDKKVLSELKQSFDVATKKQSFHLKEDYQKMVFQTNPVNTNREDKIYDIEEAIEKVVENLGSENSKSKIEEEQLDSHRKFLVETKNKSQILVYYKTLFDTIEEHLKENQKKAFWEERDKIFENLNKEISKFPIITGISLPKKRIKVIEEEWTKLENFCTKNNFQIILDGLDPKISFKIMINKLFSPPILGCIIGIMFGLSSMTNVLFSSNHFITNVVGILTISYKAYVPLLFMCTGVSLIAAKGLNLNTPFSRLHLFLSFVVRAVIVPFLGVGFVYLLRNTYGGIIETDRMFRFAIFVVWILPASPNFVIVVNLVKHFREELGYVLFWHNAFCFINLTIILLIYFLTVG